MAVTDQERLAEALDRVVAHIGTWKGGGSIHLWTTTEGGWEASVQRQKGPSESTQGKRSETPVEALDALARAI